MQDWKSHLIFGLLLVIAWLSAIYFFNIFSLTSESIILFVAVTMFSSLFPDIDLQKSKIRDWVSLAIAAMISALYIFLFSQTWLYGLAYFIVLYFLLRHIPSKHRGFVHSIKFALIFSLLIVLLVNFILSLSISDFIFWFVVVFSAYSLHLLLDKL